MQAALSSLGDLLQPLTSALAEAAEAQALGDALRAAALGCRTGAVPLAVLQRECGTEQGSLLVGLLLRVTSEVRTHRGRQSCVVAPFKHLE
jgi:hypothetical protein